MRIERITVARFGPLRDLDLPLQLPPSGGVVLVEGPNEAGKSTLLRFIRALLFSAPGGEEIHGALTVQHGGARYRLAQQGARRTLSVTDVATGAAGGPGTLQRIVGNLDAGVYRQIFAFGLTELEQLGALTGEGVQERIFSAAVAGAGRSVREVRRALAADIDALWRPRATCAIRDEAQALRRLTAAVRDAQRPAADYERLVQEQERLAGATAERAAEMAGAVEEMRRREVTVELADPWRRRSQALALLAASPPVEGIPLDALPRAREIRARVAAVDQSAGELAAEVAELERRADAEIPHAHLLPASDAIAGLAPLVPIQRQRLEEDLPRLSRAVGEGAEPLAAALRALGDGWTEERLEALPLHGVPIAELDAFEREFADSRERRREAEARRREREQAARDADVAVASLRAEGADERWLGPADEIGRLNASLEAHRGRADRLQRLEAEARSEAADLAGVLARLGPAWDGARALVFASGAEWRRRAHDAEFAASAAADARQRAEAQHEAAERDEEGCARDLGALPRPARTAAEAERDLEAQRVRAARLEGLSGTLQEWRQSQQDERAAGQARHEVEAAARAARGWVGAAAALGFGLALAAWLARSSPLQAAAVLVAGVVVAALNRPRAGDPAALASAREAHAQAGRAVADLAGGIQAGAAAAGLDPAAVDLGTLHEALRTARDRMSALEAERTACRGWEAAAAARDQAQAQREGARAMRDAARRREAEAAREWVSWCEAEGVPAHLRPSDLPAFLTDVERAAELARRERERDRERDDLAAAATAWRLAASRLAEALPAGGALPPEEAVAPLAAEASRALRLGAALRLAEQEHARLDEAARQVAEEAVVAAARGERWRAWCGRHALPPFEDPDQAARWLRDARLALERLREARERRSELDGLRARIRDWEDRARALLAEGGRDVPADGGDLVAAVRRLAADRDEAARRAEERDRARAEAEDRRRQRDARLAEAAAGREAAARLLQDCGAATDEQLQERLALEANRREWRRTASEAEDELRRRAGREAEAFAALLDADEPLRWQAERDALGARLAALRREVDDPESGLHAQAAAVRSRLAALEASGDLAALRLQVEQARTALARSIRRWVVCRLADGLIGETLKEYERSHVPEVLRSAGGRLAAVTGGRYRSVHAEDGTSLRVGTAGDDVLDAAALSRGAQEQLYLVVRLGLVDSFARQSESLPLVLDDVLVNADPERRDGLARVVAEASRDHQTFLLTCHPEVAAAVLGQVPAAQHVRLPRLGGTAARESGPAREIAAGAGEAATAAQDGMPGGGQARSDRDEAARRVLGSLRAAAGPMGRRALVAAAGLADPEWPPVIRSLLDAGLVVAEGAKRGTVYALPEAARG